MTLADYISLKKAIDWTFDVNRIGIEAAKSFYLTDWDSDGE